MTKHNPAPSPTHRPPKPPHQVVEGAPAPVQNTPKRTLNSLKHRWMIWRKKRILMQMGRVMAKLDNFPRTATEAVLEERFQPKPEGLRKRIGVSNPVAVGPSMQNSSKTLPTLTLIRRDNIGETIELPIDFAIGRPAKLFVELTEDNLRSLHEVLTAWLYGVKEE